MFSMLTRTTRKVVKNEKLHCESSCVGSEPRHRDMPRLSRANGFWPPIHSLGRKMAVAEQKTNEQAYILTLLSRCRRWCVNPGTPSNVQPHMRSHANCQYSPVGSAGPPATSINSGRIERVSRRIYRTFGPIWFCGRAESFRGRTRDPATIALGSRKIVSTVQSGLASR